MIDDNDKVLLIVLLDTVGSGVKFVEVESVALVGNNEDEAVVLEAYSDEVEEVVLLVVVEAVLLVVVEVVLLVVVEVVLLVVVEAVLLVVVEIVLLVVVEVVLLVVVVKVIDKLLLIVLLDTVGNGVEFAKVESVADVDNNEDEVVVLEA